MIGFVGLGGCDLPRQRSGQGYGSPGLTMPVRWLEKEFHLTNPVQMGRKYDHSGEVARRRISP